MGILEMPSLCYSMQVVLDYILKTLYGLLVASDNFATHTTYYTTITLHSSPNSQVIWESKSLHHKLLKSNKITQTKDKFCIHSNNSMPHLTLQAQECNPNKDITTNYPTIQILARLAQTHDNTCLLETTVSMKWLLWLWARYTTYDTPNPQSSSHPHKTLRQMSYY